MQKYDNQDEFETVKGMRISWLHNPIFHNL